MRRLWKTEEERDREEELSAEGIRMSVGNLFQRKGAEKVKDLLVIRREDGLDGRVREIAEEDLVLILFCTHRSFRK